MSSFSIDVSGARSLSTTINDQQRTHAQVPSKSDDNANVQLGSFEEIQIVLPKTARLELRKSKEHRKSKDGESKYLVLVVAGSLSLHGRAGEGPGWPHVSVNAGKHIESFVDSLEVVEVLNEEMGDLIPPTE